MKDVTDLDWCFEKSTKINGYNLYKKNKIYVRNDKNKHYSIISGNKVWIAFSDSKCDYCDEYEENIKKTKSGFKTLGLIFKYIFSILLIPGKILLGFLGILFGFNSNISKSNDDLEDWQDVLAKSG